jgi:spore coat polysaccharide biosynthesis predicted glycosyltransferase SpsG
MKILAVISLGFGVGSGHLSRTLKLISQFKKKMYYLFLIKKKK